MIRKQKELDQLLDDQSLQDVYKELSARGYLKKQFMEYEKYSSQKGLSRLRKEEDGHSDESESYVGLLWLPCG